MIIFGTYGRIRSGLQFIQALITTPSITKGFWLKPHEVLNSSPDMPEQIYRDVFLQGLKKGINIGMIYQKVAYIGDSETKTIEKKNSDFEF